MIRNWTPFRPGGIGELNDLRGFADIRSHDSTAFPAGALIKASIAAAIVALS